MTGSKRISRECRSTPLFHPPLRQGGDLRLLTAVPWQEPCGSRGHDIRIPTRNPFDEMWVKAAAVAHTPGYD